MFIVLPNDNFNPKSLLISDIDINNGYINNEVYRACSSSNAYPDYPIREGDFIIVCFNGLLLINVDTLVLLDKCTLEQETFNVPVELVDNSLYLEIK